jgi:ParB-like chromosome segregation protein Spo0J
MSAPSVAQQQAVRWHNAIVGYGEEAPDQLLAHPLNARIHPKAQQDATAGSLSEVGWITPIIVNQTTGHVIDGHLRVSLAISRDEAAVPVAYVRLSEEQERLALATLDPIAGMAAYDADVLDQLLREVQTDSGPLQALLDDMGARAGIRPPPFAPVGIEEQGRLDQKAKVTCPSCGHAFSPA